MLILNGLKLGGVKGVLVSQAEVVKQTDGGRMSVKKHIFSELSLVEM